MDETAEFLDAKSKSTVDHSEAHLVHVQASNSINRRLTAWSRLLVMEQNCSCF